MKSAVPDEPARQCQATLKGPYCGPLPAGSQALSKGPFPGIQSPLFPESSGPETPWHPAPTRLCTLLNWSQLASHLTHRPSGLWQLSKASLLHKLRTMPYFRRMRIWWRPNMTRRPFQKITVLSYSLETRKSKSLSCRRIRTGPLQIKGAYHISSCTGWAGRALLSVRSYASLLLETGLMQHLVLTTDTAMDGIICSFFWAS